MVGIVVIYFTYACHNPRYYIHVCGNNTYILSLSNTMKTYFNIRYIALLIMLTTAYTGVLPTDSR